jgi:uncharacterized protein YndB with AHSA1/START domain
MIIISNTIEIRRPVLQVFEFVADVNNNPQWMPVRGVTRLTDGAVGVGTKFKQEFLLMGSNYDLEGVITAFEENRKIGFSYDSPVFTWRGSYLFEPFATGTRLAAKGNVNLTGPMKMMETMFAPKIRKLIGDTAPNLKKILES